MIIPLISLLKLIALGSIKLIFLLFGIVFFPVFALRFILGGATSMLLPTLNWLEENDRLDPARHHAIVDDFETLKNINFTARESRHLLLKLLTEMIKNFGGSIRNTLRWMQQALRKLLS